MGRIGWADGLARYRVGDTDTFTNLILEPIKQDMFASTWLYERYTCQVNQISKLTQISIYEPTLTSFLEKGKPTHNPYYHEYPGLSHDVFVLTRYHRDGCNAFV